MNIIRFLASRLKTVRGKTIVHVGAHYGEEALRYQSWGAKRVVWIEAAPDIFSKLEQHIETVRNMPPSLFVRLTSAARTEHILIKALVGETDGGQSDFFIYSNEGASNSIFKLNREGDNRFASVQETGEVLQLTINTLDTCLANHDIAPESVDILVLDIQGAELMCLKGATRVLKSAKYVESEVSKIPVYDGGVLLSELEPWLTKAGFVRKTALRRAHMNAIFVNRNAR